MASQPRSLLDPQILRRAAVDSFAKLDPRRMARNPVMFVVELGSVLVTVLFVKDFADSSGQENVFAGLVAAWLWFTVLFANFAEAVAEGRGKAQADELRKTRATTVAHRRAAGLARGRPERRAPPRRRRRRLCGRGHPRRRRGDRGNRERRRVRHHRRVRAGHPGVRRRPLRRHRRHARPLGSDRRAGHAVPGESFLDRMIALVEGAERQKTPNEIALNILLSGLTIVFLLSVVTLQPFAVYSNAQQSVIVLVALLVCLIPTTIGGLLSAIGIAAWTGSFVATCSRSPGGQSRPPATARPSCSTRPGRSPSGTVRRPS